MLLIFLILLSPLDSLYAGGNYLAVISEGTRLLEDTTLTTEERIDIHKKLASAYIAVGNDRLAKLDFLEALFLDYEMELDPRLTSPKVMKIFLEAKKCFVLPPIVPPRPERDIRSVLIPGIIQRREGKTTMGNTLIVSGLISLSGILTSHYMCERAHERYLDAEKEDVIERRYNEYKTWYNLRGFFISAGAVTYLFHLISLATD